MGQSGELNASGAHTLGRAKPDRSGFGKEKTKYTENGPGKPGGSSWTPEWLKFDNSYFAVSLCFCRSKTNYGYYTLVLIIVPRFTYTQPPLLRLAWFVVGSH